MTCSDTPHLDLGATPPAEQLQGAERCLLRKLDLKWRDGNAVQGERSDRGSTTEARAGVTGHNVRYVLLLGTLAVIVLFAIAYVVTRA